MMCPKIKDIKVEDNFIFIVTFDNGTKKKYDFKKNFDNPIFRELKNENFFRQVNIDNGGYGISWNDNLDLSEYELWKNGVTCNQQL